jgi:exodeoxyribonuclease VII large subunit
MSDNPPPSEPELSGQHNVAEYSVGEIANAVKRTLEGTFGRVRVRGEISRPNYHGSGHLYFTLKDENAVLDGVCWRGTVGRLGLKLEEGMEVICTGRLSSYPRSSRYQIVIESVELAGEGALLKLLEDRRKKLAAEGLFDAARKQELPFLPEIIGVITSPTGAVIRDILHRLADRFPRRVILWPVIVQGKGAAEQIAAAIDGFNEFETGGAMPRPDLLIVARGGGSLEDLWAFNEEVVVRAAAESSIPLISAIGHETDTTLIDHAADLRAPTPTAAAEMAVPVRAELMAQILDNQRRLVSGIDRCFADQRLRLEGLERGLPQPERLLEEALQRLDNASDRIGLAVENRLQTALEKTGGLGARLRHPRDVMQAAADKLGQNSARLATALAAFTERSQARLTGLDADARLPAAMGRQIQVASDRFGGVVKLLESVSYKSVLERGFALVRDADGKPLLRAAEAKPGTGIEIEFADGVTGATVNGMAAPGTKKKVVKRTAPKSENPQGSLL